MPVITAPLTNQSIQPSIHNELIINGQFAGNANGWTLGDGWSYASNSLLWSWLGTEQITNGSFTGNANGWTLTAPASYSNNSLLISSTGLANPIALQSLSLTAAKTYRIVFNYATTVSGNIFLRLATSGPLSVNRFLNTTLSGTNISTTDYTPASFPFGNGLTIQAGNTGAWQGNIDNVSIKQNNTGTLATQAVAGIVAGRSYLIKISVSGSVGSVTANLGGANMTIPAGMTVTSVVLAASSTITIGASDDFNGTVTSVSCGPLLTPQAKNATTITDL